MKVISMGTMQENTMARDKMNYHGERIAWIDIYKGLAICLVVIGHATGLFNLYIYQFHMAAFFFISGYAPPRRRNRNVVRTLWDKFYTLMLPYITVFLLMLIIEGMLNNLSLYGYFFPGNFSYIGFGNSIKQLFLYGNCYAWWMGGAWFVVELFAIEILHSVLVSLSNKSTFIYLALVGIVYYTGYYFIHRAAYIRIGPIYNDLAFIGLAFYSMGFLARQTRLLDRLTDTFTKKCFMCSLSISILYIFANVIPTTVDYPSRSFNDPVIDLLIGLNGCFFIFFVAKAVEKVRYLENIFACLGKNTLGVVFFHLQFFKLGGFLLYFLNIIPFSDISNLLPAYEAGTKWWWLFAVISLAASVAEWKMLTAIKGIRFFFGAERKFWGDIYMKISERNIKIYENK